MPGCRAFWRRSKLAEAGIDFAVFEKAERPGGTWRENTYPGLSCDVPSHSYTYSFARNPDWTAWFASGPEIRAYFERVADDFDVTSHIRFSDEVTGLEFNDGWDLTTASGFSEHFDAVIAATGVLHHPNIPEVVGLDTFEGASFHTARWDHSVPLDGRRVGVVGTGSTAVQITSAIVERVSDYVLFQRTAQWVLPGENRTFDEAERSSFRADPRKLEAFIQDTNTRMIDTIGVAVIDVDSPQFHRMENACHDNLNTVQDPVLRGKLTPPYRAACKRLIFSPNFYRAIQRPNVTVVTSTIERIEPKGVRTLDGQFYPLDVLVLATGFRADRFVRPVRVIGRDGADLDDVWADGPFADLSVTVPGFPNFFMLNGPNGPVGNFSLIDVAEMQLGYIMEILGHFRSGKYRTVEPTMEAFLAFEVERRAAASKTVWMTGCNSWYLDKDGVPAGGPFHISVFERRWRHPSSPNSVLPELGSSAHLRRIAGVAGHAPDGGQEVEQIARLILGQAEHPVADLVECARHGPHLGRAGGGDCNISRAAIVGVSLPLQPALCFELGDRQGHGRWVHHHVRGDLTDQPGPCRAQLHGGKQQVARQTEIEAVEHSAQLIGHQLVHAEQRAERHELCRISEALLRPEAARPLNRVTGIELGHVEILTVGMADNSSFRTRPTAAKPNFRSTAARPRRQRSARLLNPPLSRS